MLNNVGLCERSLKDCDTKVTPCRTILFGNVLCILSEGVKTRDNKILIVTDYSGGNLKNYNIARIC